MDCCLVAGGVFSLSVLVVALIWGQYYLRCEFVYSNPMCRYKCCEPLLLMDNKAESKICRSDFLLVKEMKDCRAFFDTFAKDACHREYDVHYWNMYCKKGEDDPIVEEMCSDIFWLGERAFWTNRTLECNPWSSLFWSFI
jgi:hypothetical protein